MRSRIALFFLLAVSLIFALLFARQTYLAKDLPRENLTEKKLRILTYSTFVGATGPGADIIKRFKMDQNCDVEVFTAGDAGLLVERLKLAQASRPFDVVIGVDQFSRVDAEAKSHWQPLKLDKSQWNQEVAKASAGDTFAAFDWSPMTFVYRKESEIKPPQEMADLLAPRFKDQIALQDPRASSPGIQFYNWVRSVEGDHTADFLEKLKPNVQSVSPSWAFSYGLFKKKQASFVFSYLTSLAFHWGSERDRGYQVVSFPEGHPIQIEYAGVPEGCQECQLGQAFVKALLDPWAQLIIMEKNFMFPVVNQIESGSVFAELPKLKIRESFNPGNRDFSDWDKVFKR